MSYIDVVIDGSGPHLDRFFTYSLPQGETEFSSLLPGQYVKVPWGKATRGAVVRGLRSEVPSELKVSDIRELLEVVERTPLLSPIGWELAAWLREFYFASWPLAVQTLLPGPVLQGVRRRTKGRKKASLSDGGPPQEPLTLSAAQRRVWEAFSESMALGGTSLLHGVTGSGKTEIYLHACRQALSAGLGVLVLVPEVSLTPQAQTRFRARFGDLVSILHSGLSAAERREQWWRIRRGEASLVVGTRSAVFAPVERLGLIIIDEEHDSSYKQNGDLRYHARQVAAWLARRHGASLLLGSATPCLESYSLARQGRYRLLSLPERVHQQPMPELKIVKGFGIPHLVLNALRERKARGEQSVILLNRRGFSRYLICQECGWVPQCAECSISLTFHKKARALRCHYCGASHGAPSACADCGGLHLDLPGKGTERVESDLLSRLPDLRVGRLDRDTVGGRSAIFEETYRAFGAGDLDCLLGTQMVSKGLDFPAVTLVVVLEADTGLHLPDFRAAERTYSLLTQVAGRAGRGQGGGGEVMLVCQKPDHRLFADLLEHRWEEFMAAELELRGQLGYPPFRRMLRILVSDPDSQRAEEVSTSLADALDRANQQSRVEVLGPASCPIEKLQGRYRWHILLKALAVQDLHLVVRKALQSLDPRGSRVAIDPDPLELL